VGTVDKNKNKNEKKKKKKEEEEEEGQEQEQEEKEEEECWETLDAHTATANLALYWHSLDRNTKEMESSSCPSHCIQDQLHMSFSEFRMISYKKIMLLRQKVSES